MKLPGSSGKNPSFLLLVPQEAFFLKHASLKLKERLTDNFFRHTIWPSFTHTHESQYTFENVSKCFPCPRLKRGDHVARPAPQQRFLSLIIKYESQLGAVVNSSGL